ncbi:hypothetical protein [Streptomyces sp. NPDC047009]|uniref:hypothetical protein n=1 Tax=unclassified Streptomyces TaxID=2593676 RepID=UPI0033CB4776
MVEPVQDRSVGEVVERADVAADGDAPVARALASFRNLGISTFRLAGRANIAHARRDLLNHNDAFAVYGI